MRILRNPAPAISADGATSSNTNSPAPSVAAASVTPTPTAPAGSAPDSQPVSGSPTPSAKSLIDEFTAFENAKELHPDNTPAPAPVVVSPEPPKQTATPAPVPATPALAAKTDDLPVVTIDFTNPARPVSQPNQPQLPATRNYDGLSSEEAELFKKMSNDAYNRLRPIYDEHKTLKPKVVELEAKLAQGPKAQAASYYEHEQGYLLDPQFNAIQSGLSNAELEASYWQEQLAEFRSGNKPHQLVQDPQTGKYYKGAELAADSKTEAMILANISTASNWKQQLQASVQQLAGGYVQRNKQILAAVKANEDKYFPHFKDGTEHPYKETIEKVMKAWPQELGHNPLMGYVAKAYATIQELNRQLAELRAQPPANTTTQQDATKAGPTTTAAPTPIVAKKDDNIMDAFLKLKND